MKYLTIIAFTAGAIVLTTLIAHFGAEGVIRALADLGWSNFLAIVGFHCGLIVLMGIAWWLLGRNRTDARPHRYIWGRLIRDSASEVLPFSQVGGYVLGARAAASIGIAGSFAAASTVVDLTMELIGQLVYTALGLALLTALQPDNRIALPILAAIGLMTILSLIFFFVQARGAGLIERLAMRLMKQWLGAKLSASSSVQSDIHELHGRRGTLISCSFLHLASWIGSGIEAWITLRLMGIDIDLSSAIVIDSLLYGIRSFAFMVPNALGVQEGAYVALGSLFGIAPDVSLALSLVRRGRDLIIGVPALIVWQLMESWRIWQTATPTPNE